MKRRNFLISGLCSVATLIGIKTGPKPATASETSLVSVDLFGEKMLIEAETSTHGNSVWMGMYYHCSNCGKVTKKNTLLNSPDGNGVYSIGIIDSFKCQYCEGNHS